MSATVFMFTLVIEIFSFVYLSANLEFILDGVAVMLFAVGFLVYGCLLNLVPVPRSSVLFFASLISIVPAYFSSLYYSLSFYRYVFLSCCLPYSTIYWAIVRSLSHRRPFLKTNVTVLLYILIHIPVTLYIVNSLGMITQDASVQGIINYVIIGVLALVCLSGAVAFVLWLRTTIKELPKIEKDVEREIDYNYHEEGEPAYIPYNKEESFSLDWLASLDIRNISQLFSCIFFICSTLASLYTLNELLFTIDLSTLASTDNLAITVSQLVIVFVYYSYTFLYIVLSIRSAARVIFLVWLFVIGVTVVGLSYGLSFDALASFIFAFRLVGGVMVGIGIVGVALEVVKRRYEDLDRFLAGLISTLIWLLIVLPYLIAIPIASIYIPQQ